MINEIHPSSEKRVYLAIWWCGTQVGMADVPMGLGQADVRAGPTRDGGCTYKIDLGWWMCVRDQNTRMCLRECSYEMSVSYKLCSTWSHRSLGCTTWLYKSLSHSTWLQHEVCSTRKRIYSLMWMGSEVTETSGWPLD